MARTLYTIGDLGSVGRVGRVGRRRTMGQTNPLFAVPPGFSDQTASAALLATLNDMLVAWNEAGVPSEHDSDAFALAFQNAWNKDPTIAAAGGNALLSIDGGYGPNMELAVEALNGGSAPPVNTGTTPAAPTSTPTTPATHPIVVAHEGDGGGLLVGGLVVAGLGLAAWLLFSKKKKHTASITFHQPVHSNPRRRARHRNPMACM